MLNLNPSVITLFHPTFILVVDDLMRLTCLMMMRILVLNLAKYLLQNPCIKVILVKIVFTLDLPPLTLGPPLLPPLYMFPSPSTSRRHRHTRAPSRTVTSGALPSYLRDLPTFVVAFVHSSPPSTSFDPNLADLEASILKQEHDIVDLSTHFVELHAKLLPFCNLLAKEGE